LNFVTLGKTIETLPLGINTPFVDAALSQGQLQLLGIARAIIYNPKILLLDEMTANLDIQTEKQILEVLEKASDNKTILSISHRQSSVVNSDKIVTLEDGTIKNITYPKK
ncbi:MAG: ATP-binding cassette domain-containing protein, partial [Clostridia bacterium]